MTDRAGLTLTDSECYAIWDKWVAQVSSGRLLGYRELIASALREACAVGAAAASVPSEPIAWDGPTNLQIDSYATGRELVFAHINKGRIHLEVTDGSYQWRGSVNVPWNRAAPAVAQGEAPKETMNEWKEAVIEALIVDCIFRKEHEDDPMLAIRELCQWEQDVALDPAVSGEAVKLRDTYKEPYEQLKREAKRMFDSIVTMRLVLHKSTQEEQERIVRLAYPHTASLLKPRSE